jgi:C_GCAxxG_C_C family probable redox protein
MIMIPQEMREKAMAMFMKRFHWSQAVLAVGQEKLGRHDESLIRAMGAFGGGLGGNGEVCGALVGALAVFGLLFSRGNETEKEDMRLWFVSREFLKRFQEDIVKGSILCRDIAKVDWTSLDQVKAFYKSDKLLTCQRLTGDTAKLVGEFLEKAQK